MAFAIIIIIIVNCSYFLYMYVLRSNAMFKKFACLNYVENRDEIPVRFGLMKKVPNSFMDWYVEKFNPFVVLDIDIAGLEGYNILMPITKEEALKDPAKNNKIINQTLRSLKDYNVDIVLPPKNIDIPLKDNIWVANGRNLFPFFMAEAVKKGLRAVGRDIKKAEVYIINNDLSTTQAVIDNLLFDINFLTVVDINGERELIREQAEYIFAESGLNIRIVEEDKQFIKNADVVINTWANNDKYDYAYRKKAVLFDLCSDSQRLKSLSEKRGDMLIVDSLQISVNKVSMPLYMFELAFYVKSKAYRQMCNDGYNLENAKPAATELNEMAAKMVGFSIMGNVYSSARLSRFSH